MTESSSHQNLLASSSAAAGSTLLPVDPAAELLVDGDVIPVVAAHPTSSLGWAVLAEDALAEDTAGATLMAYAYARTGYHRGLDALRKSGWRGAGPVPWEHEPNRGFLRALAALGEAARRIGETDEAERCTQLLRDSSETGWRELTES
ncbi:MAG: DUF3151 domain-containing protein [Propionibacteriaceae bacterium]